MLILAAREREIAGDRFIEGCRGPGRTRLIGVATPESERLAIQTLAQDGYRDLWLRQWDEPKQQYAYARKVG